MNHAQIVANLIREIAEKNNTEPRNILLIVDEYSNKLFVYKKFQNFKSLIDSYDLQEK